MENDRSQAEATIAEAETNVRIWIRQSHRGAGQKVSTFSQGLPGIKLSCLDIPVGIHILYNNAARFLRLSEEEIARHHGM